MYKIVEKRKLNDNVVLVKVDAPFIARKVLPGQFVIFRIDEQGERVPVTVADYDREKGTITLIVQTVGPLHFFKDNYVVTAVVHEIIIFWVY